MPAWLQAIPANERAEAEERMRQFLVVMMEIFVSTEEKREPPLTVVEYGPTLTGERSKDTNHLEK